MASFQAKGEKLGPCVISQTFSKIEIGKKK